MGGARPRLLNGYKTVIGRRFTALSLALPRFQDFFASAQTRASVRSNPCLFWLTREQVTHGGKLAAALASALSFGGLLDDGAGLARRGVDVGLDRVGGSRVVAQNAHFFHGLMGHEECLFERRQ